MVFPFTALDFNWETKYNPLSLQTIGLEEDGPGKRYTSNASQESYSFTKMRPMRPKKERKALKTYPPN
jgi:hypothetical protein